MESQNEIDAPSVYLIIYRNLLSYPSESVTMASGRSGAPVNGHGKDEESSSILPGPDSQVPAIDDSVIADDDEGLPFISAVYSLAPDDKTNESAKSGWFISFTGS